MLYLHLMCNLCCQHNIHLTHLSFGAYFNQEIVIPSGDDAQATGPQPYDPDRKSQKSTHFAEIDPDAGLRDAMNIQDDPLDIDME